MSKYENFDNESSRKSLKLCKFLSARKKTDEDQRYEILKMTHPYSRTSPYNRILDFNNKTKAVCQNTDLSMFLKQCKVIVVGDSNCGKTSLIKRFTSSSFRQDYNQTIDVGYETKYFDVLDVGYNVGFWDVPGEEKFEQLVTPYYAKADVIVVVFDLTRPSTLANASRWMQETLAANVKSDPIRFLVGTKSDLMSRKSLEGLEAHANFVAQELDAEYFSVSSKDATEVSNLFRRFIGLAFENSVQKIIKPPDYHAVKNNLSSEFSLLMFMTNVFPMCSLKAGFVHKLCQHVPHLPLYSTTAHSTTPLNIYHEIDNLSTRDSTFQCTPLNI